jgi:hypothetical protein
MKLPANTNALVVVLYHTQAQEELNADARPNARALAGKDALAQNNVVAKMEYVLVKQQFLAKILLQLVIIIN